MKTTKSLLSVILSVLLMVAIVAGISVIPATASVNGQAFITSWVGDDAKGTTATDAGNGYIKAANTTTIKEYVLYAWSDNRNNAVATSAVTALTFDLTIDKNDSNTDLEVYIGGAHDAYSGGWCGYTISDVAETGTKQTYTANLADFIGGGGSRPITGDQLSGYSNFFEISVRPQGNTGTIEGGLEYTVSPIYVVADESEDGTTVPEETTEYIPDDQLSGAVVYEFTDDKWDWWGCVAENSPTGWTQNDNALTRTYADGSVTYSAEAACKDGDSFKQLQDKWKLLPAGYLYFTFTNNTSVVAKVKIDPVLKTEVEVPANSSKIIRFTNDTDSRNIQIYIMSLDGDLFTAGDNLFTLSAIREVGKAEEPTTTENIPTITNPIAEETTTVKPADPTTAKPVASTTIAPTTAKPVASEAVTMNLKAKAKIKLTKFKKAIKVKISKQVKNADGYQIKISKNKNFKKAITKVTTKKTLKIGKLKAKTKYFVKVRAYEIVNGQKVYGAWSKVYSKKTK